MFLDYPNRTMILNISNYDIFITAIMVRIMLQESCNGLQLTNIIWQLWPLRITSVENLLYLHDVNLNYFFVCEICIA